jgi:hypothetical protein
MNRQVTSQYLVLLVLVLINHACKKEQSPRQQIPPPVTAAFAVSAGSDTVINSPASRALLKGTTSLIIPDIQSKKWVKKSGPANDTIENPDQLITFVRNLQVGVYEYELSITDKNGAVKSDICKITVNNPPPPSSPPSPPGTAFWISMNPHDTTLNLPDNAVILTASTWSMTNQPIQPVISSIEWTKVAGPNNFTIQSPGALSTGITNLTDGLYAFQCKITDTSGWSAVSYGGVINVTDTTTPGQEIIIPDQSWDAHLGAPFIRINLSQYIPGDNSVKKVFIKHDCDTAFTQIYYITQIPVNSSYGYVFDYGNNEFCMYVYYWGPGGGCLFDPNNKPDIKIIY